MKNILATDIINYLEEGEQVVIVWRYRKKIWGGVYKKEKGILYEYNPLEEDESKEWVKDLGWSSKQKVEIIR